jgi:hypothetical protein
VGDIMSILDREIKGITFKFDDPSDFFVGIDGITGIRITDSTSDYCLKGNKLVLESLVAEYFTISIKISEVYNSKELYNEISKLNLLDYLKDNVQIEEIFVNLSDNDILDGFYIIPKYLYEQRIKFIWDELTIEFFQL